MIVAKGRLCQASLEYVLVVALTFVIVIPAIYMFYSYSRESGQEISDAQITQIGRAIVDAGEAIFYSGLGSQTVVELNVPSNVENALIIDGRELVFNATTSLGTSEIVFFSAINMTTSSCIANLCTISGLNPGLKKLRIKAVNKDSVLLEVI